MTEADRQRWNERYRQGAGRPGDAPVGRLTDLAALLRPHVPAAGQGRRPLALDLACGLGRHALYLASLGYAVDAWDVSDVAVARLAATVRRRGLTGIVRPRRVDLDGASLPVAAYDLVLDTYFLDRRLLPAMRTAVKPGGLIFVETLLSTPHKPGRPDYYLQPGELRQAFAGLTVLVSQEHEAEGWAALLARRPPLEPTARP